MKICKRNLHGTTDKQIAFPQEYVIKVSYLNYEVMRDSTEALETIEPISWTVRKRYNDFSALNKAIRSEADEVGGDIVLPGKKFTGNLSKFGSWSWSLDRSEKLITDIQFKVEISYRSESAGSSHLSTASSATP